jgi:hypothetical protein
MRKLRTAGIILVAIVVLFFGVRAYQAKALAEIEKSQNVSIIVSPSIQPGQGQAILFKATNLSGRPVGIRLNLFGDTTREPLETTDFRAIAPKTTITHLFTPPPGALELNGTKFDAPTAVRALVEPLPGGEPAAVRRVVVSLLMVGLKPAAANAPSPALDPPMIVPLERCLFASRNMAPFTALLAPLRQVWDCGQVI